MLARNLTFALIALPLLAEAANCVIQPNSVGPVRAGMTIAQVRQALKDAAIKQTEDADRLPVFSVTRDGLHTMDLYVDAAGPVSGSSKIGLIRVFDGACATREGVHPGMRLNGVAQQYGRLTRLRMSGTESREYAEFERLPTWLEIQVGNGHAGKYPPGLRCTTDYPESAHIASMWVSHPTNKPPDDSAACNVAPLRR